MPVVFDEVVGTVAPEPLPAADGGPPPVPREPPAESLLTLMRRLEQRACRLRAD
jgi:hypothetical protein